MEIKQALLHIIDRDTPSFLCTQELLEHTEAAIQSYLESIVKRIKNADVKVGALTQNSEVVKILTETSFSFIEKTTEIGQKIFDLIVQSEDVPSGDLLFFEAEEEGKRYFGCVKLDYKTLYTHYVEYAEDKMRNNLIRNKTIFPSISQRLTEAFMIQLDDFTFKLIEKKYTFDGKKIFYLSEKLLDVIPTPSASENIAIVKKAIKSVADKYNEEKYVSMSNVQEAVYESIESDGKIDAELIAERVFENNISAKKEYLERVERSRFTEEVPVNVTKYEKKYSKQKLKLTNGIEMTIPVEIYKNKEIIEFINNPDGTISVVIKNVDEIINKF